METQALEDLRAEITEAATDESLEPAERVERLQSIREELVAATDEVDLKLAEAGADTESARPLDVELAVAALRERAEVAQEALDSGMLTEAEVTDAGIFTEAEIADLEDADLLDAVATEIIKTGRFDPETGEWAEVADAAAA